MSALAWERLGVASPTRTLARPKSVPTPARGNQEIINDMFYKDYLNAARKHKYTCCVLREKLDSLDENKDKAKYKSLLLNLYYLSGYIIECIVKYGIYDLIGYPKDKAVSELEQKGLTYKNNIKHHRFERYTEQLNKRMSGAIPLVDGHKKDIEKKVIQLYKEWDAEVRYSYDLGKNEKHHYIAFYEYAEKIFEMIINNVRG